MDKLARRVAADFKAFFDLYEQQLQPGAQPRLLYITCVDSRLDPEAMMGVSPGEMYVLRVPGGMVPAQGLGDVVVMGTIELALSTPSLKHIVVCGHTDCAFLHQVGEGVSGFELSGLSRLVSMADYARSQAITQFDRLKDPGGFQKALLEALIQRNLQALREIPIVKKREATKEISLHGWYFDMNTGRLYIYDEPKREFNYVQLDTVDSETPAPATPQPQPPIAASARPATPPPPPSAIPTSEPITPPQLVEVPRPVTPPAPAIPSAPPTFTPPPPPVARPITPPASTASSQPQPIPNVAPSPVQVPHAEPVQRVYTNEVVSAAEQATEPPSPKATPSSSPVKDEFRTMFEAISSPLQRNRLRRRLNQLTTPAEWAAVAEVLKEFNVPLVRQTLREISIELSNGDARSKLRNLLSQAPSNGSSTGDWQQQVQKDFADILQSLQRKA
ncbi:MAG: hypothetical protein H6673_05445 [Anaerolineales bacterium]|nr:hypothetical protein [Anaerolineales bacterium]